MCDNELSGLPADKDKDRDAFNALYAEWVRLILEYQDPATPDERIKENDDNSLDLKLARQIIAAPIPLGFMMSRKLEVMVHYMATAGDDMCSADRLVLMGLGALRADIVNFCGS